MKIKRLLSITLAVLMLLSVAPLAVFATEAHTHTMSESCSHEGETIEFLPFDQATSSTYLTEDTSYYLTADVVFNSQNCFFINEGATLNLCLNGYSVTTLDDYFTFYVYGGGTLNICNCGDSDCYIGSAQQQTINMLSSSNTSLYGITVKGKSGAVLYDGAEIKVYGCKFTEATEYGIFVRKAKAHIERSVFCDMNISYPPLYSIDGEIYAEDCEIYDNVSKYGALYAGSGAKAYIKNTDIYRNEATDIGGGFVSYGTLTLEGCNVFANKGRVKGGAFNLADGDLTLIDTSVYGNTSPESPVHAYNNINLSGRVVIKDNVINGSYDEDLGIYTGGELDNVDFIRVSCQLVVNGALSPESEIWFGGRTYENQDYVVCDGTNVTALDGYEKYFFFEDGMYPILQDGAIRGLKMVQSDPSSDSPELVFKDSTTVKQFAEGATFAWYKNGELMPDKVSSSITPEPKSSYTLVVTLANGAYRSYSFDAVPEILSNPTVDNPTFNVSMTDYVDKYEWYVTKLDQIYVTDSNASSLCTNCEGDYTSTYDAATNLWTGAKMCDFEDSYKMFYFTIDLKEGERLYIAATPEASEVNIFDYENTEAFTPSFSMIGNVQVFTAEYDGSYTVSAVVPREDVQISAYKIEITKDFLLENETANVLSDLHVGWIYKCVATYEDGTVLTSSSLPAYPDDATQPNFENPTFEVTFADDAKYQWYTVDESGNSTIVKGETEKTLSALEYGKQYYCLASFPYGMNLKSDTVSATPTIVSQPTPKDPTFSVTYEENAEFEWYEIFVDSITDSDVASADGSYDSESDSWTGLSVYDYGDIYQIEWFAIVLNERDIVRITLENPDDDPFEEFSFAGSDRTFSAEGKNGTYIFTAPETDTYYLWSYSYSEAPKARFETLTAAELAIEGENGKTLVNKELGKLYRAIAAYENGTVLYSDIIKFAPEIIKQPDSDSPTVEVSFKDDVVSYQWYEIIYEKTDVTDENASPSYWEGESVGTIGYYDAENGYWVPSLYEVLEDDDGASYYEYDLFYLQLYKGDKLVIIPDAELKDGGFVTWNQDTNNYFDEYWENISGVYTLDIIESGTYYLYTHTYFEDITFKAYIVRGALAEAIEGEDSGILQNPEYDASYVCVITFNDGTVIYSDIVVIEEPEYTLGDVNADGAIDQFDYILIKRHYFETRYLTEDELPPADVNCDGVIDQFDYILIKRHYFGTFKIG